MALLIKVGWSVKKIGALHYPNLPSAIDLFYIKKVYQFLLHPNIMKLK